MNKEKSVALQGIAILMMLIPHFFLDINNFPESFFMFPTLFQRFSFTGRMCVGIFSFVSGYGMYQVLKKKNSFDSMGKYCIKRLFQLYVRVFLVIILCVYIPKMFLGEKIFILNLWRNIIGYNPDLNGAWWYVLEYMWFMLLAPILAMIVNSGMKMGIRILLVFGLGVMGLIGKGFLFTNPSIVNFFEIYMQPTFLIIFTEGFLAGKMQEYIAGKRWLDKIENIINRVRCQGVGILLCFVALVLRFLYSSDPNKANADMLLVPLLCCGVSLAFQKASYIKTGFLFLGKNSLYLWLVHGLVYDRLFLFLIPRTGYWLVFFIILFVVSIIVSVLLGRIEKIICNCMWKCRKQ